MSLLTSFIFKELLSLKSNCKTYKIDSEQYEKCIKLQKLSALIYEQFQKDYFEEFQQFKQLQESQRVQQYKEAEEYFFMLIDNNLDQYISPVEQEHIFNNIFNINIDENDGFTSPGE